MMTMRTSLDMLFILPSCRKTKLPSIGSYERFIQVQDELLAKNYLDATGVSSADDHRWPQMIGV
jgi:hypothetical protein